MTRYHAMYQMRDCYRYSCPTPQTPPEQVTRLGNTADAGGLFCCRRVWRDGGVLACILLLLSCGTAKTN